MLLEKNVVQETLYEVRDVKEDASYEEIRASYRSGDYFSVDLLELQKMGYSLLRDGNRISILNDDSLPGLVILPCGSCSLKARLLINMDDN